MPATLLSPSFECQDARLIVRQGRIDLSFHQVVGEVIAQVLQDARLFLGNDVKASSVPAVNVEVSSGVHPDAFRALQQSQTDILVGWFDGSHGAYVAPFRDDVIILGDSRDAATTPGPAVYNPYCIWAVPDYVPEAIVPDVNSLADPAVARRFATEPSSGKYVLQGIGPGAGISGFSKEMVQEYGLAQQGWEFRTGTQQDCFGNVERRIANEDWFVVPLWHPQYLNLQHNLRALKEPKGLLRPVDDARIVLRKAFLDTLPDAYRESLLRVLSRVVLGNDAVTLMDKYYHVDKLSYRESARRWIRENRSRVDSWFESGHVDIVQRASESSSYALPGEVVATKANRHYTYAIPHQAPAAAGAYNAFSVSRSHVIQTSFQLPWELDINLPKGSPPTLAVVGPVAKDSTNGTLAVSESDALHAVRICALNLLAQLRDAAGGDLGRVQLLRLEGYVATEQGEQVNVPRILDAASVLIKHALGPVQGVHARTALILHRNPLNVPTMLGAVAELRW